MKFLIVIASALISSSCFARQVTDKVGRPAQEVTYCQLTKDPSSFIGKRIRIRAIYAYMFEVSRLKSPTCCPERDISIWVDFDEELEGHSKRLFNKLDKKGMGLALVDFVGRFESGKVYGPFGERFRLLVDKIEKIEATTKAPVHSTDRDPVWVPKNCEQSDVAPTKQSSSLLPEMLHDM